MLRQLSLLALLIWAFGVDAEMIDNSCRNMKQYREDGTLEPIGNVYPMVDKALHEAFQMTAYAKDTMLDVEEHQASNEVVSNVIGVFVGLQGDRPRPIRSGPWNYLYGKTLFIFPPVVSFMLKYCLLLLKKRSSTSRKPLETGLESNRWLCAEIHTLSDMRFWRVTKLSANQRRSIRKTSLVLYTRVCCSSLLPPVSISYGPCANSLRDPIVNKWWQDNEHACHGAQFRAQVERNEYVMVCKNAFENPNKIEIGSQRDTNYASPRYLNSVGNTLDYWATFLSYTLLHEFLHVLFQCEWFPQPRNLIQQLTWSSLTGEDWDLNHAVRHPDTDSLITKAYGYFGSVELVFQRPHKVPTNVDNTGMFILGNLQIPVGQFSAKPKLNWHTISNLDAPKWLGYRVRERTESLSSGWWLDY